MGFIDFKMNIILIRKCIVDMDVVNDVTCLRQSALYVWPYDFYDTTLSTELQRRNMIKVNDQELNWYNQSSHPNQTSNRNQEIVARNTGANEQKAK